MKTIINVQCIDQELVITNSPVIASGGVHENFIVFNFCEKWDGFGKTAVFYRNENNKYYAVVDSEGMCEIPHEVTESEGIMYFGVFGESNGITRTSNILKYKVKQGAILVMSQEPTPDIYQQLLSAYGQINESLATEKEERKMEIAVERERIDKLTNYVTPQMFGARGDGVTDDTKAIQDAIDYCGENNALCYVPNGIYNITNIRISKNVTFRGAGKYVTKFVHIGTGDAITIKPKNITDFLEFLRVDISNFSLECNDDTENGIVISETIGSNFSYIVVAKGRHGIFIDGTSNVVTNKNSVWNNDFDEVSVSQSNEVGIKIDGIFSDTHFNKLAVEKTKTCMEIDSVATHNVSFIDGTFVTFEKGFVIHGLVRNVRIETFNIEQFSEYGILIDRDSVDVCNAYTIANCSFYPNQSTAISIKATKLSRAFIINNNIIGGERDNDILIESGSDNFVFNNEQQQGGDINISIPNTSYSAGYMYAGGSDALEIKPAIYSEKMVSKAHSFINSNGKSTNIKLFKDYYLAVDNNGGYTTYILPALTTEERNALHAPRNGSCVFDTTLSKPVWRCKDSYWVDATGEMV